MIDFDVEFMGEFDNQVCFLTFAVYSKKNAYLLQGCDKNY